MSPRARTVLQPHATPPEAIRNFCIIAHIDHGKSTLADRLLQITGAVDKREMLPSSSTGWTLSASGASPSRAGRADAVLGRRPTVVLNMIDTPGHVDFTYEVSRSLAACEGAVLLVDAAQGIEAQTLANLYLAMNKELKLIPVLNRSTCPPPSRRRTPRSSRTSSAASPT